MSRHTRPHSLLTLGAIVVASLLSACGGEMTQSTAEALATTSAALQEDQGGGPDGVIFYSPRGQSVDDSDFVWLGPPELMGGKVLEGNPRIYARIDYSRDGVTAGLFKATKGKIRVTFPFTEHATILEGEVIITDQKGRTHKYKAGDSYFVRQGQTVTWEVKGKKVIKSFFNTVESQQTAEAR